MAHSLSAVAELAVKYVNTTHRNIFLTGKAGSGKTTLLKYIVDNTYKNAVVAAPTGIAAINAGGVTLHSLLQLPFGTFIPENIAFQEHDYQEKINTPHAVISQLQMNATKRKLLQEIELLIIDEVSMLRADLLDCIDLILRHVRKRKQEPFGGIQILFIGDLNQLPPVVKNSEWPLLAKYYNCPFFFEAQILKITPPVYVELDKIYRQSDEGFLAILNRLRDNKLIDKDIENLNRHFKEDFSPEPDEGFIHITTHNRKSETINKKELEKIRAPAFDYQAKVSGEFPEHMYPLPQTLSFKKGSQVMFIKNDPSGEGQFYNGKIGHIQSLGPEHIEVVLNNPECVVHVEKYLWENKKYKLNADTNVIDENVIGSFEQYPLKLAWAITVHKSQGLTFEKAILDLTDAFAPGQLYVALSRLTSMQGLVLSTAIPKADFNRDPALTDFIKNKKELESLNHDLKLDRKTFLLSYTAKSFNFQYLVNELKAHLASFTKDENRSIKQKYSGWTQELLDETTALQEVVNKFIRQLEKLTYNEHNYINILHERATQAQAYFFPLIQSLSDKIKEHLKIIQREKHIKTYSGELKSLQASFTKQKIQIQKLLLLITNAVDNKMLTRADLLSATTYKEAKEERKKEKKLKIPTREITFSLYKEGKSIEEIAEQRGLVHTTIEGHLSAYVSSGEIKATEFIEKEKLKRILTVAKTLENPVFGAIKAKLGDEFTYADIQMAMAHQKAVETGG
ncbi:MAG: helix-turn-helix domain-containing protein [Fulvivirga sp.]